MLLDDRKAAILRAVVKEYIDTAQPVGSAHVARMGELNVSPATVRNDMAQLEREGYLAHPHTSAGRIPTDKGYRFFVDQLTHPGPLDPARRQLVRDFFRKAHGELEQMLHSTSRLLSSLTDYAAVVVGPAHEAATVRSIQVVGLAPRVALVVAVLSNGVVEKRSIELDTEVGDERLAAAGTHVAAVVVGATVGRLPDPTPTGDAVTDSLAGQIVSSLRGGHHDEPDHVFVGGAARMADAFEAVETVRQVLTTLEQQYVVVSLLQDVLDRGLSVAIGREHGLVPLAECAVVVAPYEVEGQPAGTIGVLGPTRMNYPQALAAVAVVSKRLGERLSEG
ncbi:MAG TPA: heat-inducible transcriptional repressor HrcA [Acidimicrobiales bacterium]|nr:heat-inducible transcriptional repressor HrcA [Acidimicrobiales bacterium]